MTSLDYYAIEELLTDDERAARDRTRRFVQEEVMPEVVPCHRAAKFPDHLRPRMGALKLFAPHLKEHGGAGLSYTAYGLIHARAGKGRFGFALGSIGAGRAGHIRDPFLWHARATRALVARTGFGRTRRLFRINGTRARLRPWRHGNSRQTRRRSLRFERQ